MARCLALADALRARGWTCLFASRTDVSLILPSLAASGHKVRVLGGEETDEADEAGALGADLKTNCALLVVDHYGLGLSFETAARAWATRIAVIDDLARRKHDSDILIDPTPGRGSGAYSGLVSDRCRLLLGPMVAPLRPEFLALRVSAIKRWRSAPSLRKVFVGFGATDSKNMTTTAVSAIVAAMPNLEIDVVLGRGAANIFEVRAVASGSQTRIHVEPKSVANLMAGADIGVGAAGMMSWERCCLGLPSFVAIVAENQRSNATGLEQAGAGIVVGDECGLDSPALIEALRGLSDEPARLARMAEAAAALCDGRGAERVVEALAA